MQEDTLASLYHDHIRGLIQNTARALASTSFKSLCIHSGSLQKRSLFDDQYWPLRAVPHFQHWAHLPWPDCALFFEPNQKPRLLVYRDPSFWERPTEPQWAFFADAGLEIEELANVDQFRAFFTPQTAFVGEDRTRAETWNFDSTHFNPVPLLENLDELRVFKTDYEIACLKEANRLAAQGHRAVRDAFLAGENSELALHLLYLQATAQDDPETPYKNIVALGDCAAILHHVHYRRKVKDAGSLLLDAGANFNGYASDITRTYSRPADSTAGNTFAEMIARLELAQQKLCAAVKTGRGYESLHEEAHQHVAQILVDTGLVKDSVERCLTQGTSRRFLPHGLGHSLGLQCHDVGCAKIPPKPENSWLRNTRVIETGQVFTIEPGIYFIDSLLQPLREAGDAHKINWPLVDALKTYGGIRIEDDIVVGPNTAQNLTREFLPA